MKKLFLLCLCFMLILSMVGCNKKEGIITIKEYEKIEEGMTYEKVCKIVGGEPRYISGYSPYEFFEKLEEFNNRELLPELDRNDPNYLAYEFERTKQEVYDSGFKIWKCSFYCKETDSVVKGYATINIKDGVVVSKDSSNLR